MNQYEIIKGPITLPIGVIVHLSEAQVIPRKHALKNKENGFYEVISPVQFKNGELLGFDATPDKTLLSAFLPLEKIRELQAEKLQQTKQDKAVKKSLNETKNKDT